MFGDQDIENLVSKSMCSMPAKQGFTSSSTFESMDMAFEAMAENSRGFCWSFHG